jgi:hypothetical protein
MITKRFIEEFGIEAFCTAAVERICFPGVVWDRKESSLALEVSSRISKHLSHPT